MLNILQIEDRLKDMSKDSVIQALNNPNPTIPPFLALAELNRRKRMEDEIAMRKAENQPTVAEQLVAAAGMPMQETSDMAMTMAPKTDMAQNTGVNQMMAREMLEETPGMNDGGIARMSNGGEAEYMGFTQRIINRLFGSDDDEGTVDTAQNQSMGGPDLETLYNRGFTPTQTATSTSTTTTKKNNTTTTPPPGGDNVLGSSYIAKMMKNIDKDRAELADQRRRDEAIALMTAGLNIYDRGQLSAGTEGLKSLQASNKAYRDQMAKMRGMDVQLGVAADTLAQKRQQSKDVLKAAGLKGTGLTANQAGGLALKYKNAINKMRQALEVGYITDGASIVQLTDADKQKYKDDIEKFEKLANELTAIFEGKAISPYRLDSSMLE